MKISRLMRMTVLMLGLWQGLAPHGNLHAQSELPSSQLRILIGGMMQRPASMALEGLRSRHGGRHLFLGCTYQRRLHQGLRIGLGAGLSWGSYGLQVSGTVADSSGSYVVGNTVRSTPIWYPFVNGFTGPYTFRTDPFQVWVEVVQPIGRKENVPLWEVGAIVGA